MAVAFDAVSESHTGTSGSVSEASFSWTHTPVGTPKGILVYIFINSSVGPGQVTSVTYGGVSMTAGSQIANDSAGEAGNTRIYFLGSSIPTGAQTITVNRSNTSVEYYAVAISVTASGDTAKTGEIKQEGDQAPAQANVDDGSPGTNSLRFAGAIYGGAAPPVAGANSTALISIDYGQRTAAVVRETTAGQGSRPVGFADASDDWACVLVAIKETASGFTLTAAQGSFTLTGQATTLKADRKLTAAQASFSLSGQAVTLRKGFSLVASQASFALSGQAINLSVARKITAAQGSFSLSGQATTLKADRILIAAQGSLSLTGQNVSLNKGYPLTAAQGTFTLTGQTVNLLRSLILSAAHSTFALSGQAVTFVKGFTLSVAHAVFTLSGQAVSLLASHLLSAGQATFSLAGQTVNIITGEILTAVHAVFALTGQTTNLLKSSLLNLNHGSFALAGQNVSFTYTPNQSPTTKNYYTGGIAASKRLTRGFGF